MEDGRNLEGRVQNLETRFARGEQILPTLATRDDLQAFPTNDTLRAYAAKADLQSGMHAMREFMREQFGLLRAEMASDRAALGRSTLALIEAERERWAAVVDGLSRLGEKVDRVDADARHRDHILERPLGDPERN